MSDDSRGFDSGEGLMRPRRPTEAVVALHRGDTPDKRLCPRCRGLGEAKTLEDGMFLTVACPKCQGAGVIQK